MPRDTEGPAPRRHNLDRRKGGRSVMERVARSFCELFVAGCLLLRRHRELLRCGKRRCGGVIAGAGK